jgi:hypothetical protein
MANEEIKRFSEDFDKLSRPVQALDRIMVENHETGIEEYVNVEDIDPINAAAVAYAAAEAAPKTYSLLSITTEPLYTTIGENYYNAANKLLHTVYNSGQGDLQWDAGVTPRLVDRFIFNSKEYQYISNNLIPTDNGITSITRTSGTGAAGTTDTYTILFTNGTSTTYNVVNGANGTTAVVENVRSQALDKVASSKLVDDEIEKIKTANVLMGNDSTFAGAGNWVALLGNPTFNINSTSAGKLYISLTSNNQAIKILDKLVIGKTYNVEIKAKKISGAGNSIFTIGFFSTSNAANKVKFTPTTDELVYAGSFVAYATQLDLGVIQADNAGGEYEFDYISILDAEFVTLKSLANNTNELTIKRGRLWTRGVCTVDYINNTLTVNNLTWYVTPDGRQFTIQGGSGSGVITAFAFHNGSGVNLIFLDVPITGNDGSILTLQKASYYNVPTTALAYGFQRIIIGVSSVLYNGELTCEIDNLTEKDLYRRSKLNASDIVAFTNSLNLIYTGNLLTGNDSTFAGAGNWVAGLGNPTFDVNTTTAGKLTITFTNGANQGVKLIDKLVIGTTYSVSIKAKKISGTGAQIRVGEFNTPLTSGALRFTPTTSEAAYTGVITATSTELYIGAVASENLGGVFEFDNVVINKNTADYNNFNPRITALETYGGAPDFYENQTNNFIRSLSKYDKPLTKVCVLGDSLMANEVGGAIGVADDEGLTMRPMRLGINSVPRRIYDNIKFNTATHRRLDHANWTKSGTWTTINDTTIFDPIHSNETYHKSVVNSSYVEIVVPTGKENFALICHKGVGFGTLNISLNGGSISAYGNSSINLARASDGTGDTGNPYWTEQYLNLPAGNNTIRISKADNTDEVRIWGGLYWTGNTLIVHNTGHGGHAMTDLINHHIRAEVVDNDFDAILMEITVMNECSHGRTLANSLADLTTIFETHFAGKDILLMTPNPMGTDPRDGTPNYWSSYTNPSMLQFIENYKPYIFKKGIPFVDVFHWFKNKIENRGGTLEGGEGGIYYTTDGMHPSEAGCREWFNIIKYVFENKPIKIS